MTAIAEPSIVADLTEGMEWLQGTDYHTHPPGYHSQLLWTQTIYGEPCSMKNSREIVKWNPCRGSFEGVRMGVIKSKQARQYACDFWKQITGPMQIHLTGDLIFCADLYYSVRRKDLDAELIKDLLQQSGVIKNDSQVRWNCARSHFGSLEPRAEIRLYRWNE